MINTINDNLKSILKTSKNFKSKKHISITHNKKGGFYEAVFDYVLNGKKEQETLYSFSKEQMEIQIFENWNIKKLIP